jgi:hypothetical protein
MAMLTLLQKDISMPFHRAWFSLRVSGLRS